MDIAKIRKKSQAQGQTQSQTQGREGKPEEAGAGIDAGKDAEDMPQAPSAHPSAGESACLPDKGAHGGPAEGSVEIPAGEGAAAEPGAVAAAGTPGTSGGDSATSGVQEDGGIAELLTFSLAKEEFAFKVSEVEEIIRFQRITLVPTMPAYVAGITSLRGKIIPVIDLRTRLALKSDEEDEDGGHMLRPTADADGLIEGKGKIIVLSGPLGLIGAIIDKVLGVVRLPDDVILEPPPHLTEDETKYIEGVVIVEKRFISIIRSADALNIEVG